MYYEPCFVERRLDRWLTVREKLARPMEKTFEEFIKRLMSNQPNIGLLPGNRS